MGGGGGMGGGLGGGGLATVAASDPWWLYAPLTYLACGLLAGLFCALIWFAARPRRSVAAEGTRR